MLKVVNSVKKWYSNYQNNLLSHKNGFWEMPYLANSPETIVKSIAKMPFTKHQKAQQYIASASPFMKGGFFYEELEDGFWVILSTVLFKANITYKKALDKNLSSDWYTLSITLFNSTQNKSIVDGIIYQNCTWVLFKPGAGNLNSHFKGAEETGITLYLHKEWIEKNLYSNQKFVDSPLFHFFESDAETSIWSDDIEKYLPIYTPLLTNFYEPKNKQRSVILKQQAKALSVSLIDLYIDMYTSIGVHSKLFLLSEKNRKIVFQAEKKMLQNLDAPFPGIESLSKLLGTSATNLKSNFKQVFGKTMFQFFQEKQMYLAKNFLQQKPLKISDLASSMGYSNPGKFSLAFKKHHGFLPSEIAPSQK